MKPQSILSLFLLMTPAVGQAQWWGGADLGLGGGAALSEGSPSGLGLSGAGGWERGRWRVEAGAGWLGDAGAFEGRSLLRFPWRRWTLSLDGRGGIEATDERRWNRAAGEITLSHQRHDWGLWAGYRLSSVTGVRSLIMPPGGNNPADSPDTATTPDPAPAPEAASLAVPTYLGSVTAGAWRQAGPLLLTVAFASDLVQYVELVAGPNDTLPGTGQATSSIRRAAQAELSGAWAQGPVSLRLTVGRRLANGSGTWGAIEGTVALYGDLALVGSVGKRPADIRTGLPAQSFVFAGLRLSTQPFRRSAPPAPVRPALLRVALDTLGPAEVRLWAAAPHATSVEMMSDLTDWRPRTLVPVDATRWSVVLPREPGPHRVVMRVDGGPWTAPPGLPSLEDDFHGRVGLLLVP